MLSSKYAFISACLKGEEPKTVTSEHIDKMMIAPNLQDALATIRETDIGSYLEELPVKAFDYLDQCLWGYLAQRIRYVESFKFLPKEIPRVSRAYVVKYDVSNIKAVLQGISGGRKSSMIPIGIIHNNALLDELFNAEDVDDIIRVLVQCKLGDYVPALEQYKTDKSAKPKLLVEANLDSEYYKSILNMARGIKDGDLVLVYNDRGKAVMPAYVTSRLKPGLIVLRHGGWYTPDENGVDFGAAASTLMGGDFESCTAPAHATTLAQVEKYQGGPK